MNSRNNINDAILPILDEALAQGFRVFVPRTSAQRPHKPINFAFVCQEFDGSFVIVNAGYNKGERPTLNTPVRPSRDYGSSVLVDHPTGYITAITQACANRMVAVRWDKVPAPLVRNYGNMCLLNWPGGIHRFVELTDDLGEKEISRERHP